MREQEKPRTYAENLNKKKKRHYFYFSIEQSVGAGFMEIFD